MYGLMFVFGILVASLFWVFHTKKEDGTLVIEEGDTQTQWTLDVNMGLEELEKKEYVRFKVCSK